MGVAGLEGNGIATLSVFLLRLGCKQFPVGHPVEDQLVANMVLNGDFVDVAWGVSVGYVEACTRIGVRTPDTVECAAATVSNPQARILAIPPPGRVRITAVIVVVGIESRAVREGGSMATFKLYIIDQGILAGAPQRSSGSRVDAAGKQANTRDDGIAAVG